ncbi:MAG: histidine phosphatase family protein [Proteobacteria bacterium]|nr:histidine phosphatase family protein [Pseudomonadota bacterium]MBU4297123.1 histidine phosphatase family protein [Pseudomonadota bacterium]
MRHGQIEQFQPRRFVGQLDLPLTDAGKIQARDMRDFFKDIKLSRIFTSPLRRTVQTAELVAGDRIIDIKPVPELAEINLGAWEGLTVAEVGKRFPGEYEKRGEDLAHYRTEGGESFADLAQRSLPVFTRLAMENAGPLLVVAHAGVNRVLLASLQQLPLKDLLLIPQDYCCLNIINLDNGNWHIAAINQRI